MSGIGEAFLALKNLMLLHERIERLQKELEGLAETQGALGSALVGMDRRLSRLEGFIEGAAAATGQRGLLPKPE